MARRTNIGRMAANQQRWQTKCRERRARHHQCKAGQKPASGKRTGKRTLGWMEGITDTVNAVLMSGQNSWSPRRLPQAASYADQIEKFGRNYILPVIGAQRIGDLNTGMLPGCAEPILP